MDTFKCEDCFWPELHNGKFICGRIAEVYHIAHEITLDYEKSCIYYKKKEGKQMENFIQILGQKIELTQKQVEKLKRGLEPDRVTLGSIPVRKTCKIGEYEFIVLEHSAETTAVLLKGLLYDEKRFGNNNNFDGSYMDELCNCFCKVIAGIIGKDAVIAHTVDLTSDDGLKDYGKIKRNVSLLTTDLYRRYVDILDVYKPDKWWWLATPYSTARHNNIRWVKCVSPSGIISRDGCNFVNGVRPFCILKSNIFVSK